MSVSIKIYHDCKLYSSNMTWQELDEEFGEDEQDYIMHVGGDSVCSGKFKGNTVWEYGGCGSRDMGSGSSFVEFLDVINDMAVESGYTENGKQAILCEVSECDSFDGAACSKIFHDLNKIDIDVYKETVNTFEPDSILAVFFEERFADFKSAFESGSDNGYVVYE